MLFYLIIKMQNLIFTIPEKVTSTQLKNDLDAIIKAHRGELAAKQSSPSEFGTQDTRTYEIPKTGTVRTITNEHNFFVGTAPNIARFEYSVAVLFTGFDEESRVYSDLYDELAGLPKKYDQ